MIDASSIYKKIVSASYVRYLLVGGTAFVVDYGVLLFLTKVLGLNTALSAIIGFSAGFVVSFVLNRSWSFSSGRDRSKRKQLIEYSALVVFNMLFTAITLSVLESIVPIAVLKPIIVTLITVWNYFIYYKVIFKNADEKD